jgi:DNA-binding CsgD family transcriptional regulator
MGLRERDLRAIGALVADLGDATDVSAFARLAVNGLLDMVPTDVSISFNELRQEPTDLRFRFGAPVTSDPTESFGAMALYWRQSPTAAAELALRGGVYRWSDLIERRDLERLEYYQEVCLPRDERFTAKVAFPGHQLESNAFMLVRKSRDFTDREMTVLRTMYPFLLSAYRGVLLRERVRMVERHLNEQRIGVIPIDRGAGITEGFGAARAIVERWFGRTGVLPEELSEWVTAARRSAVTQEPLLYARDDVRLVIKFLRGARKDDPDEIFMQEIPRRGLNDTARALGLTAREIEVLRLVRDGMTNRAVAEALFLAPTTVRHHLENVFAKLDVQTRTAAIAKAFPTDD